ncbi:unnamed protein product [Colias eurytheme]|nr:unnamed protein product [Colias eurytheme]
MVNSSIANADSLKLNINHNISLLGIYRTPSIPVNNLFLSSLDNLLQTISDKPTAIVAGDLNIDICNPTCQQSLDYLCLMSSHCLLPTITKPTRGDACLDHIFIKASGKLYGAICQSSITDHDIVIGLVVKSKQSQNKPRWRIKTDTDALIHSLKAIDWNETLSSSNVDEASSYFYEILSKNIEKHSVKMKVSRRCTNIKPWITPGLIRCIKHRDKLHKEAKAFPYDQIRQHIYKRYRNFCNKILRNVKIQYNSTLIDQNKSNTKMLWQTIKNISYPSNHTNSSIELLHTNNDINSSLNNCNKYFTSVGKTLSDKILTKLNISQGALINSYKTDNTASQSFFLSPTDETEVRKFINSINNDSSPGIDNLTVRTIKAILPEIIKPVTHIYNLSLETGVFPNCWKTAVVIPIYKSGIKNQPENYRPIALLNILGKVLEKIVNYRLTSYLDKYQLISDNQFGFRKNKSTEHAISLLTNLISSHIENKECCIAVFLDLAKAFDTISLGLLAKKLEVMGVRDTALNWFKSYLTDRTQCIKIDSNLSSKQKIEFGVPHREVFSAPLSSPFTLMIYSN